MQYKDDKLLQQSSYGELYAELYQRYASVLFAYVYQHLSSREDAEDIVLSVFLSVLQNQQFPTFDEQKQEAWLWTITRNKTVDHLRRSTRRPQVSLEWFSEPLYADDGGSPEQISLAREEYRQLAGAVHQLPALQQEVLRLRFGHGLNSDEIGAVVEKSGSAVRMLLHRTLRLLRTIYKNQAEHR
ncbi:MAG TPA: RNA polymerase sigma factor [Ktedonobacteraceae bacterium]|jgi:RNA polymerase sigma-70 factor (ECF subfamily)|nr:RNA polymerase sigma factor [Ktedonobacteraceae bacterium]